MKLRFQEFPTFYIFQKPYGLRTHAVANDQVGFVETLSEKLQQKLFVVHRLDKGTSGLILFAKDSTSAQSLAEHFQARDVLKNYLFLTDKKHSEDSFTIKSHIEKIGNEFISHQKKEANSETEFKLLKHFTKKNLWLWQASPKTGKPHQIRLHAAEQKIAILGDDEHGGSPFFRLALHAYELKFGEHQFQSQLPPLFENPEKNELTLLLEEIWHHRSQLFQFSESECFRLIHKETSEFRADIYGDHLWVYDYTKNGFSTDEKKIFLNFAESKNRKLIIRHMLDRGQGVGGKEKSTLESSSESCWIAEENGIKYLLKTNSGFSSGLFLDQRENRNWVKNNCKNKTVLNLFCYTSGFSVCAGLGKAKTVTSVDVSKKFLEWSKENFKINQLNPENYEFFAQDSLLFLKGALKRGRKWDMIICDPPSFGRSKEGIWRIEKDLPTLAELLFQCLADNGKILFTSNYEGWDLEELKNQFAKKITNGMFSLERLPYLGLDFELTDSQQNLMKGFFANKR